MRVFNETQRFRQWWLFIVMIVAVIASAIPFFSSLPAQEFEFTSIIAPFFTLAIFVLIFILRLETKINNTGISARFEPLPIFRRNYKWEDMEECFVRTYAPVSEYGGWGIRGFGKAKAYNVSGNKGIQIITKNKERFLIGTEKPDQARKAILRNFKKV